MKGEDSRKGISDFAGGSFPPCRNLAFLSGITAKFDAALVVLLTIRQFNYKPTEMK